MKYFVYKGTGGLFHNLRGLTVAIELSIKNNVILIIDMDTHGPFGGNFSDYFVIKCDKLKYVTNYENIPLNLINDIQGKTCGYVGYTGKNACYKVDKEKEINIFYGYGIGNCILYQPIQVNSSFFNKIQIKNLPINKKYLSVHFRNTDIKNNDTLFFSKIQKTLNKYKGIKTLYIASDDYYFYENIKKYFTSVEIIRKTFVEPNISNLHYGSKDKKTQMYDCLVDIYYILLSDVFIPSINSGFSQNIIHIIRNKYSFFPNLISKTIVE